MFCTYLLSRFVCNGKMFTVVFLALQFVAVKANVRSALVHHTASNGRLHQYFVNGTLSRLPIVTSIRTPSGLDLLAKQVSCESQSTSGIICLKNKDGNIIYGKRVITSTRQASYTKKPTKEYKHKPTKKHNKPTKKPTKKPERKCTAPPVLAVCCNNEAGLKRTPKSYVDSKFPYSSVVLIVYDFVLSDGTTGQASCTGTLISSNLVLTAGHCVTEKVGSNMTSTFVDGTAYFNVYNSHNDGPAIAIDGWSIFTDWQESNAQQADQCIFRLSESPKYKIVRTADYLNPAPHGEAKAFSVQSLISIGFPGFADTPSTTFNNKFSLNHIACINTVNPSDKGSLYLLKLDIGPGMSGGPVIDTATDLLVATNSFGFTLNNCNNGSCYNGYVPIDNVAYPLQDLISSINVMTHVS